MGSSSAKAVGVLVLEAVWPTPSRDGALGSTRGDQGRGLVEEDGRAGLTDAGSRRPGCELSSTLRYAKAGVSPATVGYVEAHGTGTALGDVVEIEALTRLFRETGANKRECIVGSVKSMIGHTKCAAGLAGLINASLALYHKVLPPTIGVEAPNPKLDLQEGPLRLCTQPQPWLHSHSDRPRRAGVSAFGFGGTNFHAKSSASGTIATSSRPPRVDGKRLAGGIAGLAGRRVASARRANRSTRRRARTWRATCSQ